jgi:isoleucyl-tRNA synthetase
MAIIDRAADRRAWRRRAWSRVTAEEIIGAEDARVYRKSTDILGLPDSPTFFHRAARLAPAARQ